MNLLITSAQEEQAYIILLCLRDQASKIVVAMHGTSLMRRWSGLVPYSRYVDRRYTVPDPSTDWWAGNIQESNTPSEEAYVQRIEAICVQEGIEVIFPCFDPEVYILSKNKHRLQAIGVVVVAPDYESTTVAMDKLLTLEAAESVGFPCPQTLCPAGPAELSHVADQIPPPWVIKPRFTAHGRDTRVVGRRSELAGVYWARET